MKKLIVIFLVTALWASPALVAGEWSNPHNLDEHKDRKKVAGILPWRLALDQNKLRLLAVKILQSEKRASFKFLLYSFFPDGRPCEKTREIDFQEPNNLSRPIFHKGSFWLAGQDRGGDSYLMRIGAGDGVVEKKAITVGGQPLATIGRFAAPSIIAHDNRFFILWPAESGDNSRTNISLLESSDGGDSWKNIAPQGLQHYSFRDGIPTLFATHAFVHMVLKEKAKGPVLSHYRMYDRGGAWLRDSLMTLPGKDIHPYGAVYSGRQVALLYGFQAPMGGEHRLFFLKGNPQAGSYTGRVVEENILKIFNEHVSLAASPSRFAFLGTRRNQENPFSSLSIKLLEKEGLRDISLESPPDHMLALPVGTFSRDGRVLYLVHLNIKSKFEEGVLKIVFRRWSSSEREAEKKSN